MKNLSKNLSHKFLTWDEQVLIPVVRPNTMKKQLVEGLDFYYNEMGYVVLTASYHLEKGSCCGNGCLHCPYDYINVPEPRRMELIKQRADEKNSGDN